MWYVSLKTKQPLKTVLISRNIHQTIYLKKICFGPKCCIMDVGGLLLIEDTHNFHEFHKSLTIRKICALS